MPIITDFYQDYLDFVIYKLHYDFGYKNLEISKNNALHVFHNLLVRRVQAQPRKVHFPKNFICPEDQTEGLNLFLQKVRLGHELVPHQSKQLRDPSKFDKLLFDWGIQHFHLGLNLERNSTFIERTRPLLLAVVTIKDFYIIKISKHDNWTNIDLLEIVLKNWPELLDKYKLSYLPLNNAMTEENISQLRKANVMYPVQLSNGILYSAIGGGVSLSGHSLNSSLGAINDLHWIENMEKHFHDKLGHYIFDLYKLGYRIEEEIIAKLIIKDYLKFVFIPKFNYWISLN